MNTGLIGFSAVNAPLLKVTNPALFPVPPSGKMTNGGKAGSFKFCSTLSQIASTAFYLSSSDWPLGINMHDKIYNILPKIGTFLNPRVGQNDGANTILSSGVSR